MQFLIVVYSVIVICSVIILQMGIGSAPAIALVDTSTLRPPQLSTQIQESEALLGQSNQALALYQNGKTDEALNALYRLVRQYPKFADIRAALTAILWIEGNQGEAVSEWVSAVVLDPRYTDLEWLRTSRCWPPRMIQAMETFLAGNP